MDFSTLKTIIKISRPPFWVYLAGPFLIGYIAAISDLKEFISLNFIYSFFYFLIPANIFIYGVNDLSDKDTDRYNTKKNTKENRYLFNQKNIYLAGVLVSIFLSVPLLFIGNNISRICLIVFLILGFFYSVPPIRFKSKAFLDFLSNSLYALPGLFGYSLIANQIPDLYYIIAGFFWCFSMHLFSAIPDINPDMKARLITSAVKFGKRKSLIICFIFWSITTTLLVSKNLLFLPLIIYPTIPLYILFKKTPITKTYWRFPLINLCIGAYLFFLVVHLKNIDIFL